MILKNFTLLYVEDDQNTQDALKDILELKVKELYIASNGEEGLECYKKYTPDIVLTDINMPKMNGIEMSKAIKLLNPYQPIAILTAFNEPVFLKQAINLGIDKYIVKPITNIELFFQPLKNIAKILQYDIDKKRMEEQLYKSERMAAMGEMIGNISHQWRQPLSVISTASTGMIMQKEYGLLTDELLNKACYMINDNAQYLSKTIDDFINFIKGERKKAVFSLKKDIESFLHLVEGTIKSNNINIILDLQDDIDIDGYNNELTQCLINIFNNAKDALIEQNIEDKYIFISTSTENKNAIIEIKDNAKGIPKDILSKIFDPYFTTKHKSQGTGLGLHMTYNLIVDGMDGTIDASNIDFKYDDKDYNGALFKIELPLVSK